MKKIIILATLLASVCFTSNVYAIGAGASAGVFLSENSEMKAGHYATIYGEMDVLPMVDLKLQYSNLSAKSKKAFLGHDGLKQTSHGYAALIKVSPPIPIVDLYAAVGWAYYKNTLKFSGQSTKFNSNGLIAQAGVGFSILILDLGLEFTYIANEKDDVDYGGYALALKAGVSF